MTLQTDVAFDGEHLRALHEVGKAVAASLDLDTTLSAIVAAAHRLTRAHLLAILLLEDADHLVIRVGWGDVALAVGERVGVDQGVVGRALREKRLVLVDDMQAETERAWPDLDARSGLRSYLAVPLIWRGDVLGAVTVGSTEPRALSPTAAALIQELANQAAAAVAHAHAYAREQARLEQMETLYRALDERTLALEHAQQQLVQGEKLAAIGQLVHQIAHELNTPLGVIVSNLSVLGQYGEQVDRLQRLLAVGALATDVVTVAASASAATGRLGTSDQTAATA